MVELPSTGHAALLAQTAEASGYHERYVASAKRIFDRVAYGADILEGDIRVVDALDAQLAVSLERLVHSTTQLASDLVLEASRIHTTAFTLGAIVAVMLLTVVAGMGLAFAHRSR